MATTEGSPLTANTRRDRLTKEQFEKRLTREQVALSTLIADGLMDPAPTRSIADRADVIVRWMLREPDVVRRALDGEDD